MIGNNNNEVLDIQNASWNGNQLNKIVYNGDVVWERVQNNELPEVLRFECCIGSKTSGSSWCGFVLFPSNWSYYRDGIDLEDDDNGFSNAYTHENFIFNTNCCYRYKRNGSYTKWYKQTAMRDFECGLYPLGNHKYDKYHTYISFVGYGSDVILKSLAGKYYTLSVTDTTTNTSNVPDSFYIKSAYPYLVECRLSTQEEINTYNQLCS